MYALRRPRKPIQCNGIGSLLCAGLPVWHNRLPVESIVTRWIFLSFNAAALHYNMRYNRSTMKLKVTQIGSSKGVILPKELLEVLHVDKGDALYATPTAVGGLQLTPYEPEFEVAIKQARSVMRRYRNTLRKLAE